MTRYQPPENKKPVMKAKHLHQIPEKKKIWPCSGDIKKDGVYAYQIMREDDYRIFSRTGMEYTSLKHIETAGWMMHANQRDVVLLMEIHHDTYPVNIISGYCRDQKVQHPELYAVVHDTIPYSDFIIGVSDIPYIERRDNLRKYIKHTTVHRISDAFMINDEQHAEMLFKLRTAEGEEGLIGRPYYGKWLGGHRKNENYWKMKIELSYDLYVSDVRRGKGKYANTLGTIDVMFRKFGKASGEIVHLPVSGMTDDQRRIWWDDPSKILGKIVKVDAMTFTKNGLLREPRFKEVREDKLVADIILQE